MIQIRYILFLLLTLSMGPIVMLGQDGSIQFNGDIIEHCSRHFGYYSTDLEYDISEVMNNGFSFDHKEGKILRLGTTQKEVWLKGAITNNSDIPFVYIEIDNPTLDFVTAYFTNEDEEISQSVIGQGVPFEGRKFPFTSLVFEIPIATNQTKNIYFKVKSNKTLNFPINIGSEKSFIYKNETKNTYLSIFFGLILALSLFNLFLYLSIKNKKYGYYAFFVFFSGFIQLVIMGFADRYFWPGNEWLSLRSIPLFAAINGLGTLMFFNSLLKFKETSKFIHKFYLVELAAFGLLFVLSFPKSTIKYGYDLMNLLSLPVLILVIATVRGIFTQLKIAKLVLIALFILASGMIIYILKEYSIIPYNTFTNMALPVSKIIEFFVLSVAISGHIQNLKLEKERSDFEKMRLLETNKNLVEHQKEELKIQVSSRTFELKESNNQLKTAYKDLKSTQNQLIESEKLASLGQLTAGIAHELNNPINFISGNVNPLKRDIKDLLDLIQVYDDVLSNKKSEYEIETFKNTIELDYLKKEIDMLLDGISDGSTRTAEIVGSLKLYSHMDNTDKFALGDINNGIESTVVILRSNYREDCKVTVDLDDELPLVECQIGKINQVLMNLISNAIHATMARHSNRKDRVVHISSIKSNSEIKIIVKDNGTGMDETTRNKIFDPFFTTKKQGEGTGLGLSLVKSMVDTHQGNLKINSELGKGTEFILTLPIHLKKTHPYRK